MVCLYISTLKATAYDFYNDLIMNEYLSKHNKNIIASLSHTCMYVMFRAMDLSKAKEELSMRRKHRAMVSQMASKNRRQKKIKSRK